MTALPLADCVETHMRQKTTRDYALAAGLVAILTGLAVAVGIGLVH